MIPLYIDPILPRDFDGTTRVVPPGYVDVENVAYRSSPPGDYTGQALVYALGSFWSQQFQERGILTAYGEASSLLALQNYINYLEAVACVSRFTVPIFHCRAWYALVVKESELNKSGPAVLKYGGSGEYGAGYQYGVPTASDFFTASADELRDIAVVMNRILAPTLTWVSGHEFFVEDGIVYFRNNPFADERIPIRNVVDSTGAIVDRECVLWAFSSRSDQEFIYQHYGYALQRKASSSEGYRDLTNAIWNGLAGGLSAQDLSWALAAIAGLPVVLDPLERVEVVVKQPSKTVVVTNRRGYIYPAGSIAAYSVGDIVRGGTPLVDTVRVFDLATFADVYELMTSPLADDDGSVTGAAAASSSSSGLPEPFTNYHSAAKLAPPTANRATLRRLALPRGLLGAGYVGSLSFANELYAIETELDNTGRLKATFGGVDGAPADIDRFWTTAHANGVAAQTWLELFDVRIPQVNAAGFIIDNFLRNNAILVHIRVSKLPAGALGISFLDLLRRVLPPEKLLLLLLDVEIIESGELDTDVTCSTLSSSANDPSCDEVLLVDAEVPPDETVTAIDHGAIVFTINECP